jgi:hypothetical protein
MNKMLLPDSRAAWATQHMNQNRDKALVQLKRFTDFYLNAKAGI